MFERVAASDLRDVVFFDFLSPDEMRSVAAALTPQSVPSGQTIFREGEASDTCYFVVHGAVDLVRDLPGGPGLTLATIGAGGVFGEVCLLTDQRRSATAVAREDGVLWRLARQTFDNALKSGQLWAYKVGIELGRILAGRLARMDRELVELIAQRPKSSGDDAGEASGDATADVLEQLRSHLVEMASR